MAISGKSEKDIWEFLDQVSEVMVRGVDTGLAWRVFFLVQSSCIAKLPRCNAT